MPLAPTAFPHFQASVLRRDLRALPSADARGSRQAEGLGTEIGDQTNKYEDSNGWSCRLMMINDD